MKIQLEQLKHEFEALVREVEDRAQLEELRHEFLGRKGKLKTLLKTVATLAGEERKAIGQFANEIKDLLEVTYGQRVQEFLRADGYALAEREWIDLTEPGQFPTSGHLHPVTQSIYEIEDIFAQIGFLRYPVPEVDWDYYTFEALNFPADHPARDNWETFFVDAPAGKKGELVAIPHISNVQVRAMEQLGAPFRILYIGRSFRRQSDPSHSPMFHQFEVLMVDQGVNFTHLRGVIDHFVHAYFGPDRKTRLRPHHFRFTEPSFEVDISCDVCQGTGHLEGHVCRLCKEGWLELAGAGMTHPNVLKSGGLDPEKYTALAFAFGIERTMMMRSGMNVDDIRLLYKNDLRFVKQF